MKTYLLTIVICFAILCIPETNSNSVEDESFETYITQQVESQRSCIQGYDPCGSTTLLCPWAMMNILLILHLGHQLKKN
uniref:U11-Deinotoxin-Dsu1g_1 n=1 Tax=Deinopis subrufa TaxID=1905329 RepID=A0A4Q8KD83_DEISU